MADDFNEKIRILQKKLRDPKISKQMDTLAEELGKTIDGEVSINITIMEHSTELDRYEELYEGYKNYDFEDYEKTMTLDKFINFIDLDNKELKLFIDPLHLKKGLNRINNVIALEHEDKLIIVPKTFEDE